VPFVNYVKHYRRIWNEITETVTQVLSKGDLILRDQLKQFEENIAAFIGTKYAIGLNSGTDALFLSLKALGINSSDEVITVSHSFVATAASIVHCGAKPVLVDIGDDMNMDVEQVEQVISPRTRAIMPVHLNGRMCDMERLAEIANEHNLLIIEDAAQALGAKFDGRKAGSIGLTGCFSFYPAKVLGAAGDAGLLATNDEEIAEKTRLLRDHGQQRATGEILFYGFNSRMDNIQAAILNIKLKYLPKWIERRRELANVYHERLSSLHELKLPPQPQSDDHFFDVYQNYVVRSEKRDRLVEYLRKSGVEILISWPKPMHFHEALGLKHFHLPKTEQVSNEVLSLPMYPELSNDQVEYVVETVHNFYKGVA
jgi:dTDP-4-amino-4,6-dideoxygalactose transaminase